MIDWVIWVLAFVAGIALGLIFFGGLWLTVKRTVSSKRPAVLFLGSLLLRVSVALVGFYFVSQGSWQRLLFCLVGFIVARYLVIHFTKLPGIRQRDLKKDNGYAS